VNIAIVKLVLGLGVIAIAYRLTRSVRGATDMIWAWIRFALRFLPFMLALALLAAGGIATIIGAVFLLAACSAALHYYLRVMRPTKLRGNQITGDVSSRADQNNLGITHYSGLGVPQDFAEAMKWFRLAADQGNASAQSSLGVGYALGRGVPQDFAEAVRWFRRAAIQRDAYGQFNLGRAYYKGDGVPQDFAEAARWFRRAAIQGDAAAKTSLDIMQEKGILADYTAGEVPAQWESLSPDLIP
jgi:TPR repeat protein